MKNLIFLLLKGLLTMILIVSLPGCMQYYKVKTVNSVTPLEITKYIADNKFIIVHQENAARRLFNPYIRDNILSGNLINLTVNNLKYKTTKLNSKNRYRKSMNFDESNVLNEVHLYLERPYIDNFEKASLVEIPVSVIAYSDIYNKDKTATLLSWGGTALVGTVGGVILFKFIAHALSQWFGGPMGG